MQSAHYLTTNLDQDKNIDMIRTDKVAGGSNDINMNITS